MNATVTSYLEKMTEALDLWRVDRDSPESARYLDDVARIIAGAADVWWVAHRSTLEQDTKPRPSDIIDQVLIKLKGQQSERAKLMLLHMAEMGDQAVEHLAEAFEGMEFMPMIS